MVVKILHTSNYLLTETTLPVCFRWSILDFLVIALGYLELGSLGNYTAIRVVRALRPLRVIQKIEEMRVLVETLIR